jgi:hypothetical protein
MLAAGLLAGCATSPGEEQGYRVGQCQSHLDDFDGLVVEASMTVGLGPDGAIVQAWQNATIIVMGPDVARAMTDEMGCALVEMRSPGTYVVDAETPEGMCAPVGEAVEVHWPEQQWVRLHYGQPCA